MKFGSSLVALIAATVLNVTSAYSGDMPEPGPENHGVRLRLVVRPSGDNSKLPMEVGLDLINVSRGPVTLRANWKAASDEGDVEKYVKLAASIESDPPIEPWRGQLGMRMPWSGKQPEFSLGPGKTLSIRWQTGPRQLKTGVSDPLEVQNPMFVENGLYAVHAKLQIGIEDQLVLLRSNEQLVAIGGSNSQPRYTYGEVITVNEKENTAMINLGSLHGVAKGDKFRISSGLIGRSWTLTITDVDQRDSVGNLKLFDDNPHVSLNGSMPRRGAPATLIRDGD